MSKYLRLLKLSFINRLDYRQELLMSLLTGAMIFTGYAVFWKAVFGDRAEVNGYSYSEIMLYYLLVRVVSEIVDSKLGFRVSDLILTGQISNLMIKPLKVRIWLLFEELGRTLVDLFLKLVFYVLLFLLVFHSFDINYYALPIFLLSLVAAGLISYSIFFLVGCTAFWSENATGLNYALRRIILFLAGGLIPLAFFPSLFQEVLGYLPFKYIFDLPVKILTADVSREYILQGLAVQSAWILVLWLFVGAVFNFAIKRNESVGL